MRVSIFGTYYENDYSKLERLLDRYLKNIPVNEILVMNSWNTIERNAIKYALKHRIPYCDCSNSLFMDIIRDTDVVLAFPCGFDFDIREIMLEEAYCEGKKVIVHELLKEWDEYKEGMNIYMMYHYNKCRTGFRIKSKYWKNGYAVVTRVGCAREGKRINWEDPNLPDKSVTVDYYNLDDEKTGTGLLRKPESLDYQMILRRTVNPDFPFGQLDEFMFEEPVHDADQ